MILTSKNYNRTNEVCKEEYYFLIYSSDVNTLGVIRGFFFRENGESPWNGKEKLYEMDDFIKNFPGNEKIINELQEDINKTIRSL